MSSDAEPRDMALSGTIHEEEEENDERTEASPHLGLGSVSDNNGVFAASGQAMQSSDVDQPSSSGPSRPSASKPRRPGPTAIVPPEAEQDLSAISSGSGTTSSNHSSSRVPAAGAGTRTGPRPVPRSSSGLRHVASSRGISGRGVSFGSLPEGRAADSTASHLTSDTGSAIQRKIDAEERKRRATLQQEDFWAAESSDEEFDRGKLNSNTDFFSHRSSRVRGRDHEDNSDEHGEFDAILRPSKRSSAKGKAKRRPRRQFEAGSLDDAGSLNDSTTDEEQPSSNDEHTASGDEGSNDDHATWSDEADETQTQRELRTEAQPESSTDPEATPGKRHPRYSAGEPGGPSVSGPRKAPWHPQGGANASRHQLDSPPLPGTGRNRQSYLPASTPGVSYPPALNTPLEGSPGVSSPEFEPRQRLEWQTMLESVLASEVLRSETKRITSVDTPDLSRSQLMYRRWLDIRASLRGRGHLRGAVDAEERRLKSGWPELLKSLIADIKACRAAEEDSFKARERHDVVNAETSAVESSGETALTQAQTAESSSPSEKDQIYEEVGHLLQRVDDTEAQFPSLRKAIEVVPEWDDPNVRSKLEALYAWYNTTTSLAQQLRILREWTGSETLQIDVPMTPKSANRPDNKYLTPSVNGELESMTFVERILKEDSLQSTFEKRTLGALNQLICKARDTTKTFHEAFARLDLPPFTPELVQLISFPMRLMEGALRLRLDYAGKIKEPSLLIVDSLTDDLRSALDVAIRTKRTYLSTMVPEPSKGWNLPPVIDASYDEILRDALRFFFRLISFKLKGSIFFKETEILDNEWQFLSQAVEMIDGGDIIVAQNITRIVNKLFKRISTYFERELSAPTTNRSAASRGGQGDQASESRNAVPGVAGNDPLASGRGPSTAGGLTKGTVHVTLSEKVKWIHSVFDNVRIRSRKLLGFARDVRQRLDNAAEYDLSSLKPPVSTSHDGSTADGSTGVDNTSNEMDLNSFMQTLINADYFLVYTETYEEAGIYIIAEPSLHDKPEVIEDIIGKCVRKISPHSGGNASGGGGSGLFAAPDEDQNAANAATGEEGEALAAPATTPAMVDETVPPHYLLLLTPRDPFMWTGKVMPHKIEPVEVNLMDRRLRLIADGSRDRLQTCKEHFYRVFTSRQVLTAEPALISRSTPVAGRRGRNVVAEEADHAIQGATSHGSAPPGFPLEVITDHMAHMADVQAELRNINKGVFSLSNTILEAVAGVRRNMRGRHKRNGSGKADRGSDTGRNRSVTESEELIQNCFSMAAEQGFRSLPFIESARLRGYMTLSLARLSIEWVGFICDDCVPTDRKTFRWAVAALENAVQATRNENIFHLAEQDFNLMRAKVASCVALLISHFDILGARSSVAKAKEEQERLEREKIERSKTTAHNAGPESADSTERHAVAARLVNGLGPGGAGPPPMLNRADSGMQATEERWVQKMIEWDQARAAIETEQRLIGRVLDDTRLEDQGLQFLASSNSRIQIRWQQGRFIGGGTFGTVYLAVNLDSGGLMAVKEIRFQDISSTPSLYKQIKDEMNVMEMLSHPNIVEYYGIEVHRDKVYIFEEYCQGGSLAQLLEHGRIEDEAVTQVYTLQMLDGLVYLHSQGVVHRDIKPDNILLDHMGVIKFVDFGAAKVLAKNSRTVQRSRRVGGGGNMAGMVGPDGKPVGAAAAMGSLQGTPMYMSPEVIKGDSRGRRGAMDVWSLGCVVLEFATGRRPWSQLDNEWAIMFHIGMAQQHPPLPEPGQLSELGIDFIRQCLIIDPYDRPSAAEMRQHPWIQNLVEQIDAAANEEIEAGSAPDGTSSYSYSQPDSATSSFQPPQHSVNPREFMHADDSAAGIAAMVATPGTRSVNGFTFQRPGPGGPMTAAASTNTSASIGGNSGLSSRSTPISDATGAAGPETADSSKGSTSLPHEGASEHDASGRAANSHTIAHISDEQVGLPHPQPHTGYPAAVADLAWKRESQVMSEMHKPLEDTLGAASRQDEQSG